MDQWKVSAMPVLEGEGRVIGVVSEADLLPKEEFRDEEQSLSQQRQRLADVAKAGATRAEEPMSTPAVARIMAVRHVRAARGRRHRSCGPTTR